MGRTKHSEDEVPAEAVIGSRGVMCLEGERDDDDFEGRLSVEPLLRLLVDSRNATDYVHRDVATWNDFAHHLDRWITKDEGEYPLLYLAFHGAKRSLHLADREVSLADLRDHLAGSLAGRTVYFGSCRTVATSKEELQDFCRVTRAKAVAGYTRNVPWLDAAAFDLLVIARLLSSQKMNSAFHHFSKSHPVLTETLGLRIVTPHWASMDGA